MLLNQIKRFRVRNIYTLALVVFFVLLLIAFSFFTQASVVSNQVCVEKNILLQNNFTVKIRPKKESCNKNEEEMKYERNKNGTILLFPLISSSLEETASETTKEKESADD